MCRAYHFEDGDGERERYHFVYLWHSFCRSHGIRTKRLRSGQKSRQCPGSHPTRQTRRAGRRIPGRSASCRAVWLRNLFMIMAWFLHVYRYRDDLTWLYWIPSHIFQHGAWSGSHAAAALPGASATTTTTTCVSTSATGRNAAGGLVGWKEGLYGHADLIAIHTIYTDWRGFLTPFIFPSMLHCRRCGRMRWSSWTATGSAVARSNSTGMGHRHERGRDTEAELRWGPRQLGLCVCFPIWNIFQYPPINIYKSMCIDICIYICICICMCMCTYSIHVFDLGHKNQFELHMHAAIQQPNIYTHTYI